MLSRFLDGARADPLAQTERLRDREIAPECALLGLEELRGALAARGDGALAGRKRGRRDDLARASQERRVCVDGADHHHESGRPRAQLHAHGARPHEQHDDRCRGARRRAHLADRDPGFPPHQQYEEVATLSLTIAHSLSRQVSVLLRLVAEIMA